MNENLRKKLVDAYFMQRPQPDYIPAILFALGGLLVSFIGTKMKNSIYDDGITSMGWQFITVGVAIIVTAIVIARQKYNSVLNFDSREKATDHQMDMWLEGDKEMILKESLQSLDMESDDARALPLMIDGTFPNARMVIGDDKVLRFDAHSILIFYLTDQHVATFKCKLDMALGCMVEQSTREFPYKDITNLETTTINTTMEVLPNVVTPIKGKQEFSLYTSGTNKISVYYLFSKISEKTDYILMPSDAEKTIKAVRKKLKEYKDRLIAGATELNMS